MSEAALNAPYVTLPPTQDELPCDDGMPMETARHRQQMELLIDSLHAWLDARPDGYAGGNMFIHFSLEQVRRQDFWEPDFFLVLGVPKTERKSWVVWEEGKGPDIVIELLSETTAKDDKSAKKAVYQDQLRVSEYFWYDPFNPDDWAGFKLSDGRYEPLMPDAQDRLVSPRLNLALVRWRGLYGGVEALWLRWAMPEGELLPTRAEAAAKEAEVARREAETAQQEAEAAKREAQAARQQAVDAERQRPRRNSPGCRPCWRTRRRGNDENPPYPPFFKGGNWLCREFASSRGGKALEAGQVVASWLRMIITERLQ